MQATASLPGPGALRIGRPFVSTGFDLVVIAGGLTFPIALWSWWDGRSAAVFAGLSIPLLILLVNQVAKRLTGNSLW